MSKRIIIESDPNGNQYLAFYDGTVLRAKIYENQYRIVVTRPIQDYAGRQLRTIENNGSEQLNIGDKRFSRSFFIRYWVVRGSIHEVGTIMFTQNDTNGPFPAQRAVGTGNAGISFSFTAQENYIVMTAILTNASDPGNLSIETYTMAK